MDTDARTTNDTILMPTAREKPFTLNEANRSLVYVERVVYDIVQAFEVALVLRDRMDAHWSTEAEDKYVEAMDHLGDLIEELAAVGVELKDFRDGLVDFPAVLDGRPVTFSWRLGEPEVMFWHDPDEDYLGRHEIEQPRASQRMD